MLVVLDFLGRQRRREHDGQAATLRSTRWCSDTLSSASQETRRFSGVDGTPDKNTHRSGILFSIGPVPV
jgi:hypothetical protein